MGGTSLEFGLLFIYFLYGLAFWAMGLAVLLESGRAPSTAEARRLQWLAAFGTIHGTHEWLEAYLLAAHGLGVPLPLWLDWFRLGLLAGSFLALGAFSLTLLGATPSRLTRPHWPFAIPVFVVLWWFSIVGLIHEQTASQWIPSLDAVARYAIAVPSAVLASMAMLAFAGAPHDSPEIASNLRLAAMGFAGYALGQLFVHRLAWFPANWINQESLLALTGIPVQAFRALMAGMISIGLLRALRAEERVRQAQLAAAQQARLDAVQTQDQLRRELLRHVVRSQEDERARIARELHDQVAQLLSAFSLQLGSLRSKSKAPEILKVVDELQNLSRQMSQSLYGLVRDLRPSHLDNLGLVPALKFLFSQDFQPQGLEVVFEVHGRARPLQDLVDTALFRVVQESLTNVLRHAAVPEAFVSLNYESESIKLCISDRGRGFNPSQDFRPPRGWGLAGMQERVEALGGTLRLHSTPSYGTTIDVEVPLIGENQENDPDG